MKKERNFPQRRRLSPVKSGVLEKKCKKAVINFVQHEEKLKK